ncbi:hypothetical protein CLV78_1265 [Aliiruegeria haliotis]|uniref:Uncharacterized protein n=1 Tax=Aliiruegeria haliotis TaxID=1280846 RepID=A0A2T0RDK0_9RHOB|nr:hypothetical protein [Aliiruegeria haliotis]PRY19233.1 hypothetical protein CLV78_1265 [Aliiruegeria haliotis]
MADDKEKRTAEAREMAKALLSGRSAKDLFLKEKQDEILKAALKDMDENPGVYRKLSKR